MNLEVTVDDAGWRGSVTFAVPMAGEDRAAWDVLMQLGLYFTLRLPGEEHATLDMRVEELQPGDRLSLSAA